MELLGLGRAVCLLSTSGLGVGYSHGCWEDGCSLAFVPLRVVRFSEGSSMAVGVFDMLRGS